MESTLIAHVDTEKIDRQALALIPTPLGTETHRPIPHIEVVTSDSRVEIRKHAQARALFAQEEYILPARFDDTSVPGMTSTVAFQDLRHTIRVS